MKRKILESKWSFIIPDPKKNNVGKMIADELEINSIDGWQLVGIYECSLGPVYVYWQRPMVDPE